jgi:hypothetical protein
MFHDYLAQYPAGGTQHMGSVWWLSIFNRVTAIRANKVMRSSEMVSPKKAIAHFICERTQVNILTKGHDNFTKQLLKTLDYFSLTVTITR